MGVEKLLISASLCHYVIPNIKIFQIWMVNFIKRFIITSSTRSHYFSCCIDCLKPRKRVRISIFMSLTFRLFFLPSFSRLFSQDMAYGRTKQTTDYTRTSSLSILHRKPSFWGTGAQLTTIPDRGSHPRMLEAVADHLNISSWLAESKIIWNHAPKPYLA